MSDRPDPFVPVEVDLRGMEYMPLKGDILFKSTTWVKSGHEARCAMLRLWWHSFGHEVPAASLPNDDDLLADYAGYGDNVKAWNKVKDQAMRGWVLCSDGRWHHKIVAELALEAWKGRVKSRTRQKRYRDRVSGEINAVESHVTVTATAKPGNGGGDVTLLSKSKSESDIKKEGAAPASLPKAHCLPVDWKPSDDLVKYAIGKGHDPDVVAKAFVDYWTGSKGKKTKRESWTRTFEVWCDRETPKRVAGARPLSFDERKAQSASTVVNHDSEDQWRVRLKGYKPTSWWPVGQWGPRPGEAGCRVPPSLLGGSGT